MTQQHGLTLGSMDFVSEVPTDDGYVIEAIGDGTSFGNPTALIETVRSLLTDGSLAVLQGWDNRQVVLRLRMSAPAATAGPALAAAESVLMAYVLAESKDPLIYTPPADDSEPCVFDVVAAQLDRDYSGEFDVEEPLQEFRYYLLTLTCLPFARAEETSVASAIPLPPTPGAPPVVTTIDTCGSTVGWTLETSGSLPSGPSAVTYNGQTAIQGSSIIGTASQYLRLVRAGAISVPSDFYLMVDAKMTGSGTQDPIAGVWQAHFDGVSHDPVAVLSGGGEGGSDRLFFADVPAMTSLKILWDFTTGSTPSKTQALRVLNVAHTDTLGDATSSTYRQQSRTVTVAGSAPTTAALRVYDATPAALGTEILVHTSQNTDWQPPLRRRLVTSALVTADTAMVSGGRHTLTSATVFEIPASLFTDGTYSLMARVNVTTAADLTWSARMVDSSGATTVGSSITAAGTVALGVTSGYEVLALGSPILPVVDVEGDQMVELTLTGTANMTLDEAWLFGLDDGALTWLRDADSLTWVEIRSPELDAARPSVFGGLLADRSDGVCVDWKCESFGIHRFNPGSIQVTTVTSTSLESQSEIEFYQRGHSHIEAA